MNKEIKYEPRDFYFLALGALEAYDESVDQNAEVFVNTIRSLIKKINNPIHSEQEILLDSQRCCENGYFGVKHHCRKQPWE